MEREEVREVGKGQITHTIINLEFVQDDRIP